MANQPNNDYQEIDLSRVSRKVKGYFSRANDSFFDVILFFKKYAIIIIVLVILGVILGYFQDKNSSRYEHKLYVIPNFKSVDYLYSKIDYVNSKISERDTVFLREIGIENSGIGQVEIEPVIDIYNFIEGKDNRNYEMLKLLAESNDLAKVMEEDITAKNYKHHLITFSSKSKVNKEHTVAPLLAYLNDSDYFKIIQREEIENLKIRMTATDSTISQINGILSDFSKSAAKQTKGESLIYYNNNTEVDLVIEKKNELVEEQAQNRIDVINYENIIKESSTVLNNRKTDFFTAKMKYFTPLLFILAFALSLSFRSYYKKQSAKRNLNAG